MSLVETYHAEHKARLARMGGRTQFSHPGRVYDELKAAMRPVVVPPPMIPIKPEFFYPKMWFWDLVTMPKRPKPDAHPPIQKIIAAVSERYGVTVEEIHSIRRDMKLVVPRQVIMYLARELTPMTYPQIGRKLGDRDHTTIIHGWKKITRVLAISPELRNVIAELKKAIG